ncbi:S-layer homology domain-containing protein [Citricoccus sp. GCM10030269]|uniref:S-layer homology domain-containing protein n=1 Tax=Citricoccus sp. GCM10030269 TaxID=3273388 RepID=UPI0036170FE8
MNRTSPAAPGRAVTRKKPTTAVTVAAVGLALMGSSLAAAPATAATDAETIAPYGGYVEDVSIVEDVLPADADTMTVAVDFCLAPGSTGRRGVEDISLGTATPIASWEGPVNGYLYRAETTVKDSTGQNTFQVEMVAAPLETEVPLARSVISIYPVAGPATSKGGCGTVELPAQIPPSYWGARSLTKSFEAGDGVGNTFSDTFTVNGGDESGPGPDEPHLEADLIWYGEVEWYSTTAEGPAESVSLTLDLPGQCSDVAGMSSSAGANTENWRQGWVSCAQGMVYARLDGGLFEDERFTVEARDSSGIEPGESVTGRTTINLDGEYHRLELTVELGEATASFDRPWAPVAFGDLCPVSFSDTRPGGAFFSSIHWLGCEGVSAGQANGAFGVNREITRGELATFLMWAYEEKHSDPIYGLYWFAPKTSPYEDMKPGSAYYDAATWLRSMGIAGYADGTFKPSRPVSRVEAAQFIYLADMADESWTPPTTSPFADISAEYSRFEAISYLYGTGATRGYTDGTFRPSREITRGEMAKFVETVFND